MATTPGNGSANPFGDGAGKAGGANVPGNNFIENPGGSGNRGTGRRFDNQQTGPQRPREAVADRSTDDAASGGLIPKIDRPDAGVGSIGNATKPYRLNG